MPKMTHKARKDWNCPVCHQVIPEGTRYKWAWYPNGTRIRVHPECRPINGTIVNPKDCPKCKGKGELLQVMELHGIPHPMGKTICDMCKGSGKV